MQSKEQGAGGSACTARGATAVCTAAAMSRSRYMSAVSHCCVSPDCGAAHVQDGGPMRHLRLCCKLARLQRRLLPGERWSESSQPHVLLFLCLARCCAAQQTSQLSSNGTFKALATSAHMLTHLDSLSLRRPSKSSPTLSWLTGSTNLMSQLPTQARCVRVLSRGRVHTSTFCPFRNSMLLNSPSCRAMHGSFASYLALFPPLSPSPTRIHTLARSFIDACRGGMSSFTATRSLSGCAAPRTAGEDSVLKSRFMPKVLYLPLHPVTCHAQ